tara:strand:+ start:5054 stop:5314 length:261 start_codon:yes stop_codon:yes gene_type:complete
MKTTIRILAVLAVATLVTSCTGPKGCIQVENAGPLIRKVTERHDQMLNGELDPSTISEADKASYLRSSEILNGIVDAANGEAAPER